jgi:putative phosphoribosyl transferase
VVVVAEQAREGVGHVQTYDVRVLPENLHGTLRVPAHPVSLVVFAHGSGSSRFSPRNVMVAESLNRSGIATLLFDLLLPEEESANNRAKVFEIPFLADRLVGALRWSQANPVVKGLPTGLFGASTGAAAALEAAARVPEIAAVVSRGGRPDLAGDALLAVRAPTLLIVGGEDRAVIELNERAYAKLGGTKKLVIIPGATHLYSERGALEQVVAYAKYWFETYLKPATRYKR